MHSSTILERSIKRKTCCVFGRWAFSFQFRYFLYERPIFSAKSGPIKRPARGSREASMLIYLAESRWLAADRDRGGMDMSVFPDHACSARRSRWLPFIVVRLNIPAARAIIPRGPEHDYRHTYARLELPLVSRPEPAYQDDGRPDRISDALSGTVQLQSDGRPGRQL